MSDLYDIIMRCLQAGPYAGQEFQDKAFQWLEDSQSVSQEELESGWAKLHAEYERLAALHRFVRRGPSPSGDGGMRTLQNIFQLQLNISYLAGV
jgi:hypothetical protein